MQVPPEQIVVALATGVIVVQVSPEQTVVAVATGVIVEQISPEQIVVAAPTGVVSVLTTVVEMVRIGTTLVTVHGQSVMVIVVASLTVIVLPLVTKVVGPGQKVVKEVTTSVWVVN